MQTATVNRHGALVMFRLAGCSPWVLAPGLLLLVQSALLLLAPLLLVIGVVDQLLAAGEQSPQPVVHYIQLTLVALVAALIIGYAGTAWCGWVATRLVLSLRQQVAARLVDLPLHEWMQQGTTSVRQQIEDNLDVFHQFVAQQLPLAVRAMCVPLILIAAQFAIDWRLALVSLIPVPLAVGLIIYSIRNKASHQLTSGYYQSKATLHHRMIEFFAALPAVKMFRRTAADNRQVCGTDRSLLAQAVAQFETFMQHWIAVVTPPWARFHSFLHNAALPVLALGVWLYQSQSLSAATLLVFALLGTAYIRPLFALANLGSQLSLVQQAGTAFAGLLNSADARGSDTTAVPSDYAFRLHKVSFGWGDVPLFDQLSLTLPADSTVALVGPSGSGKSTLALLLAGVLRPTAGTVELGGVDLASMPSDRRNQYISLVLQQSALLATTLEENVALAQVTRPQAVVQSLHQARLGDLLASLADGVHTNLGRGCRTLSGGEMQRVQIARAMYKRAPVVILDEATAFCDADNEYAIQQAIAAITGIRTLIVITHRLATVQHADHILVLQQGRLQASGTHPELLAGSPTYQALWQAQQQ